MGAQSPYNNQRENGEPCPQTGLKEAVPLHEIPALIIDLTIILVIAAGTTLLCKKIHLPSVLGYILAGFLAGPVVDFLPTIQDRGGIEVWSDIGVIFLMFGLGLEFSLHKLAEVGGPGLLSAGIQAAGMGGVGVLLGLALGWGPMNSLFLGVMLAMSSTMITMKNVEDLGMKEEKFAGLAMGTLVIEDLLAIFAMVVLSTIAVSQSISGWALAQEIGLSTELGAFLAGSLLAGTVHAERVEHLVTPCKHLFGAVFFVSVGFMVQPAMIAQYIGPILLLSGAAIIGKLLFLTLGGLAAGQPLGVCLPAAAAQTQVGEFSFILAGLGQSLSVTGAFLYPVIVAVSVITTFTTPFLLRLAGPLQRGLERVLPQRCLAALDRYCQARGREKGEEGRDWTRFLQGYGRAFALYGVLAVGVILLGTQQLLPLLGDWLAPRWWLAELLTAGVIYLALAFLLPAMLRMKKRYFTALWLEKVSNRVILSGLMALRLGAAALLAAAPAVILFQASPLWMSVAALPVIWMATHSDRLAGRYLEVEARFLANFNERKLAQRFGQGEEEVHLWLTQQLYVIPLVCPPDWAQGGKTLHDLDWGRRDHVSVLKVRRGQTHWNIPEGNVALAGGDQLVVMGSQRQVENFCLQRAEEGLTPAGELMTLKDYIASQQDIPEAKQLLCCGVSLDKTMPQAGKSVRDSGIKGDWSALLIGLERDLLPIPSPDPSLTLRDGDLLWVMGSQEMAGKLLRLGLLD